MTDNFLEIWHGDILPVGIEEPDYYQFLNHDEKEKAMRFARPELQQKYIKTRGVLRSVLGECINVDPQRVELKIGEYGKPFLAHGEVFFNLSHTDNKLVIAVSNCGEIGVDIEQYKKRAGFLGLVDKCFSVEEKQYWLSLSEDQKVKMFYRLWVRKEAFVKAVGRGVALGLIRCVVNPKKQTHFMRIPEGYGLVMDWKIVDVVLNKEDVCAVVMKDSEFCYRQTELK